MKHSKRLTAEANPDMTPMLDIVFIMLIFFIVTASFVKESGIVPNFVPKNTPITPPSENRPLMVHITDSNLLEVDGRKVDVWAVAALMKEQQVLRPDLPVILDPAESSNMRTLIRLYDAARQSGLTKERILIK